MSQGNFYQTDFTKQILFLGDGSYLDDAATAAHCRQHLGMMNETGSYRARPGCGCIRSGTRSPSSTPKTPRDYLTSHADAIIFYIMAGTVPGAPFPPLHPGLRSIPRWIPSTD